MAILEGFSILNVIPGQEDEFIKAFSTAQDIISKMAGYLSHQLKRCIEKNTSQFIYLVEWEKADRPYSRLSVGTA